jgi:pimeloyl-ACP methyl ester carboxylesterase
MLQFQPPGFGQRVIETSLGVMVYYIPSDLPWHSSAEQTPDLPSLVFLHSLGGGSSAYEWSKVYPAFAAQYRVIAPDLIGWGQSTHPQRDYRMDDYFAMLAELIEQTAAAPAIACASSLTAGITIRLAIRRPDLFQQLFLICPAGYNDFGGDYTRGIAAQIASIPGIDRLIYAVGAANEVAVRNFLEMVLFAERSRVTPEMVMAYLASAQQLNAEYAALSSLRGDLCFDLSLYIGQLSVSTVIIWGENSRLGSPTLGRRLEQLNPKAIKAFCNIPGVGVLPHLEAPEIVIGIIQSYLVGK